MQINKGNILETVTKYYNDILDAKTEKQMEILTDGAVNKLKGSTKAERDTIRELLKDGLRVIVSRPKSTFKAIDSITHKIATLTV